MKTRDRLLLAGFVLSHLGLFGATVSAAPGAGASLANGIPQSACYPDTAAARKWPVKVVYLHGLFAARGRDAFGFRGLEQANRQTLRRLADLLHVRIALPVASRISGDGLRQWNGLSLPQIEQLAQKACGVDHLAPARVMIGFSNGGYAARQVGTLPCDQNSDYAEIFAIGAPEHTRAGRCGSQLVNRAPHEFPTLANLQHDLAPIALTPPPPSTVAAKAPRIRVAQKIATVAPTNTQVVFDDEDMPAIGR